MTEKKAKWQVLVKWDESNFDYINMVIRDASKGSKTRRYHVSYCSKKKQMTDDIAWKEIKGFDGVKEILERVAKEVLQAKQHVIGYVAKQDNTTSPVVFCNNRTSCEKKSTTRLLINK